MKATEQHKPIHILLADDDMDDCMFFKKALSEITLKTQLSTVPDGEKLMLYLQTHFHDLPDVLFLDLSMPKKTGFECLAEIKETERFKNIPIVVFTTSFRRGDEFEDRLISTLTNLGAEEYIRKPNDIGELKNIIGKALNRVLANKVPQ
jgi:CheY-like chemotaxis protein